MADKIPDNYILNNIIREDGKSFEMWYDPVCKDIKKSYIKREIK